MLEKLKAAIDQARADGREVPAVIEELFTLLINEIEPPEPEEPAKEGGK